MDEECVVCISSKTAARVSLSCGHAFHESCVEPWLLQKGSCPLCRDNNVASALIYAANPEVKFEMQDFKPVTPFWEDGVPMSGWVVYTRAELDRVNHWMRDNHMVFVQDEMHHMDNTHVWMFKQNALDRMLSDLRQQPQQPPYGDFYVE